MRTTILAAAMVLLSGTALADSPEREQLAAINASLAAQTAILQHIAANTAATNVPKPGPKALWLGNCDKFLFLGTGESILTRTESTGFVTIGTLAMHDTASDVIYKPITGPLATQADAYDLMARLFIRVNGLNMTLADVPVDAIGARDCAAWNLQLMQ